MDEQNPRLGAERIAGRADEKMTGYDSSSIDPRAPESPRARPETTRDTARESSSSTPRTREIRAEIDQTREELAETVDAIQDRLRPGNIAANAADTVRTAARERVRDVAESDSVRYVRANPIPTAMVGIGIAGLAWLALGGNEARRYSRGSSRDRSRDEVRARRYPAAQFDEHDDASGYTPGLSYSESDRYYRESQWGVRKSGSEWQTGDMKGEARETLQRAGHTARRTWNENPLMVGAASVVLGAIVGLSIPETEREHELMGETRDSLVDTVQETVRDKVGQVQQAATDALGSVKDAIAPDRA